MLLSRSSQGEAQDAKQGTKTLFSPMHCNGYSSGFWESIGYTFLKYKKEIKIVKEVEFCTLYITFFLPCIYKDQGTDTALSIER